MEPMKIIIIFDKNNGAWFYCNHFTVLMGYKSKKDPTIFVSKENIKKYIELKKIIKPGIIVPPVQQPKTRFINEKGAMELLNKSKLSSIKGFRYWFNHILMPKIESIRDKF